MEEIHSTGYHFASVCIQSAFNENSNNSYNNSNKKGRYHYSFVLNCSGVELAGGGWIFF